MEIEQKVDSAKDATSVPSELQGRNKAITSRVTNTSIVVGDGDYLMMGGLMSDKVDETVSKVPLLGDIPILGWLFKSKTHTSLKTNLIILLRPRIITTGVLAGNVIKDSLQKRRDFIEENLSGSDEVEKGLLEIEDRVDEQIKHTGIEPLERYRNNEDIDEEPSKPLPTVEKPELLKPNEPKIEGSAKDS
jgi:general secretion pathway protein D